MTLSRILCLLTLTFALGCGGDSEPAAPAAPAAAPAAKAEPAPAAEAPKAEPPAVAKAAGPAGDAAAGKAVYDSNCLACHQADGTGMGGALGADFVNDKTRSAKSDAELLDAIANGVEGTTMIAWSAVLDAKQQADVLAYIRTAFMK